MAAEVVLPRQGWTMEVGAVVEWLKRDGDEVRAGEPLFTLQSDKAVNEIEALDSGILRIPPDSPRPGVEVPIGTLLAYIVQPGEPAPFESDNRHEAAAVDSSARSRQVPGSPVVHGERTSTRPARLAISPRARRIARELGVDAATLRGSGLNGRIVERDIRAAVAEADRPAAVPPAATAQPAVTQPASSPIRRLVARRMAESSKATAPVTLTTDADATELVALRERAKAEAGVTPSYNDFFIRMCALALREHPDVNASWIDDDVVRHDAVHVGLAVETERGLVVPVVRDADRSSVGAIAAESARLIERARTGRATADELSGGTFTITNLGAYEIDAFTPIVNLPECAILGIGRIVSRAVVVDEALGTIAARKIVALSLTFDHRVVDGAPAARFLQRVKQFVERPSLWLFT